MTYNDWKKNLINIYQEEKKLEMSQFGIVPIDETFQTEEKFLCTNIFATNNNELLRNIICSTEGTAIVIGYGGNSNLHLGHLLLTNEILFYLKNLINTKIYFINFEPNDSNDFVKRTLKIINNSVGDINYEVINFKNIQALKLKMEIAHNININTVNRIMGWKNESIQNYEKVLDMLTTFSIGKILPEKYSIIITDINQKTFYALFSQRQNKLSIESPCFLYHMLLPSLKSPNQRMSIKNPKSLIYLDEGEEKIKEKLKKSYSGIEHRENTCSILKISDLVLSNIETEDLLNNCIYGGEGCKICKEKYIEQISKEIVKTRSYE